MMTALEIGRRLDFCGRKLKVLCSCEEGTRKHPGHMCTMNCRNWPRLFPVLFQVGASGGHEGRASGIFLGRCAVAPMAPDLVLTACFAVSSSRELLLSVPGQIRRPSCVPAWRLCSSSQGTDSPHPTICSPSISLLNLVLPEGMDHSCLCVVYLHIADSLSSL